MSKELEQITNDGDNYDTIMIVMMIIHMLKVLKL